MNKKAVIGCVLGTVLVLVVAFFNFFKPKAVNIESEGTVEIEQILVSSVHNNDIASFDVSDNVLKEDISSDNLSFSETAVEERRSLPAEEGFFLDLSHFVLWESGDYNSETGEKEENYRRIRYPGQFECRNCEYVVSLSEGYTLNVFEYSNEQDYLGKYSFSDGGKYLPSKEAGFFTISLKKDVDEKKISPGQWSKLFGNDVRVILCTENMLNFTTNEEGSLIEAFESRDCSSEEMSELLLSGQDDELASILWNQQVKNGIYSLNGEELNNGNITYYVSSSEGDDCNSGLDKHHPRKSLSYFSGFSNVNVLLKCGDTFDLSEGLCVGNNCIYAAYGDGNRPVLYFYRPFEEAFYKDGRAEHLWVADVSEMDICDGSGTKDNCNIGQLVIGGELNLNRCVWSSDDSFNPESVVKNKDNAWAVDWVDSKLYLYYESDPNEKEILYSPPSTALTMNGVSNVMIKGLEIRGAGRHAINLTDTKNISVSCCYINHIGGSVLRQAGVRYGNGIQVWNSGEDIDVEFNYLSWIFDTCFTNQGSDTNSVVKHLHFNRNIGAHFYWGIEVWGSGYSKNEFSDVVYSDNILFDNVDVTNPTTPMHAGPNTRLQGITDEEYVSYRNGYRYHQMSAVNVSNSGIGEVTRIENNLAWNSNRFLVLANNSRNEESFSPLKNNLFYAEVAEEEACMLRFTQDDKKNYCVKMEYLDESNEWSIHLASDNYEPVNEKRKMKSLLTFIQGID